MFIEINLELFKNIMCILGGKNYKTGHFVDFQLLMTCNMVNDPLATLGIVSLIWWSIGWATRLRWTLKS